MYEPGFMACDVAVIRYIVVTLERYMSRPWLIEKIQILIWHKHLHCSLIENLTISLYGYRIRYLVESNCEGEDYYRNDNRSQADEARRNLAYHVPHLLASQLDIICFFFFLFHVKSILVSQFQLILHKIIVCSSLGCQRFMIANFNHISMVDDHNLVGILHRA